MNDLLFKNDSGPNGWGPLGWLRDVALSVVLAVILIVFIYQPVKVEGTSMMPTLTEGERIFINKISTPSARAASTAVIRSFSGIRSIPANPTSSA